jgi:hypothetical protein
MTAAQKLSAAAQRIWNNDKLQPQRVESFVQRRSASFAPKAGEGQLA